MTIENIENLSMTVEAKDLARACALWCQKHAADRAKCIQKHLTIVDQGNRDKRKYEALPFYKRWLTESPMTDAYYFTPDPEHDFYFYVKNVGMSCDLTDQQTVKINIRNHNTLRLARLVRDYMNGKTL